MERKLLLSLLIAVFYSSVAHTSHLPEEAKGPLPVVAEIPSNACDSVCRKGTIRVTCERDMTAECSCQADRPVFHCEASLPATFSRR